MLYKYLRIGAFGYEVLLANGSYTVRLGFVEPDLDLEPGERASDVAVNGETVLEDFDALEEAGEPWRAVTRTFSVNVTAGSLVLDFVPTVGEALVSVIRIEPQR